MNERREKFIKIALGWGVALVFVLMCVGVAALGGAFAGGGEDVVDSTSASGTSGAAAASGSASSGSSGGDSSGREAASAAAGTHTVTDTEGRSVTLPATPQNIAILDSFAGELAIMLGAGERVCGVPGGVVSDSILQRIYPDLATKPVQLSGNAVNVETLMAAECDVALVKETLTQAEREKLERVGIPYVVVGYTTIEEQIAAMRLVGEVCGSDATAKAEKLASYYEQTLALVEQRVAQIPAEQRVRVYHAINDLLLTDAEGSLGADWITRTGCVDVSASSSATSGTDYTTTLEQIYAWDPDVIICNVASSATQLETDAKWAGLRAVSAGALHVIPTGATRWGQRGDVETWLAMLWLGCTVYPEQFSDLNLKDTVVSYYHDYLGIEVDDSLYAQMLSGEGIRATSTGTGDGTGQGQGGRR